MFLFWWNSLFIARALDLLCWSILHFATEKQFRFLPHPITEKKQKQITPKTETLNILPATTMIAYWVCVCVYVRRCEAPASIV